MQLTRLDVSTQAFYLAPKIKVGASFVSSTRPSTLILRRTLQGDADEMRAALSDMRTRLTVAPRVIR